MPDPDWTPVGSQPAPTPFARKLGTYLLGVGIGLALLGWIQYKKHQATQQQRQSQQQDQPQVVPETPNPSDAATLEPSP